MTGNHFCSKLFIFVFSIVLLIAVTSSEPAFAAPLTTNTSAGWIKYPHNPVLGGKLGTCFDISVLKEDATFHMWFSWRPRKSIAITDSQDGFHWSDPQIVL